MVDVFNKSWDGYFKENSYTIFLSSIFAWWKFDSTVKYSYYIRLLDVIYFLKIQNLNENDNLEAFFSLACYTGLLIVNYSQYEKFPYPFMRHLRLPINLGIVLILNIIMSVPYIILKKKLVIKLKKE